MNKKIIFSALALLLFILLVYFLLFNQEKQIASSIDSEREVSTLVDWQAGTYDPTEIDLDTSVGSMLVLDRAQEEINLADGTLTSSIYDEKKNKVIDKDYVSGGGWGCYTESPNGGTSCWWQIDLGTIIENISSFRIYTNGSGSATYEIYESTNGTDFSLIAEGDETGGTIEDDEGFRYDLKNLSQVSDSRYIKFVYTIPDPCMPYGDECPDNVIEDAELIELEIYQAATATHTTAPTQIDGQEGDENKKVIEWTSFTPTQTTPANTSISYEFRTSDDGSSWTSWSAPQAYSGSPLDLTTLTPNRYLQVRATLSTTDALATPQIDDYTINFHNNQKPNKPTAQTAVIGN